MGPTVFDNLSSLKVTRKSGRERFTLKQSDAGFNVLDFWSWSGSDLVENTFRGILAEFLVAQALGASSDCRKGWANYDVQAGDIKIEVKSAAYVQSWFQKKFSAISFVTRATRGLCEESGLYDKDPSRKADVYVLALLNCRDEREVDPLNLDQWLFFVVPTCRLNAYERSQHSISLASLVQLGLTGIDFSQLAAAVREAYSEHLASAT